MISFLHLIYSLSPLLILQCDLETGNCRQFFKQELSRRILRPIYADVAMRLKTKLPDDSEIIIHPITKKLINLSPHGGSPLVYVPTRNYLLGVLHVHYPSELDNRVYINYPFKFQNTPPYNILEIGSALPLNSTLPLPYFNLSKTGPKQFKNNYPNKNEIAFVSDITVWEENNLVRIAIVYGAGDAVSRIFFTTLDILERDYFKSQDL